MSVDYLRSRVKHLYSHAAAGCHSWASLSICHNASSFSTHADFSLAAGLAKKATITFHEMSKLRLAPPRSGRPGFQTSRRRIPRESKAISKPRRHDATRVIHFTNAAAASWGLPLLPRYRFKMPPRLLRARRRFSCSRCSTVARQDQAAPVCRVFATITLASRI